MWTICGFYVEIKTPVSISCISKTFSLAGFCFLPIVPCVMTSSNRNNFYVTGPLCGEFTGHRHRGQWRGTLMFSLICSWINGWVNNREAGDLRRYRTHYDVSVMWRENGLSQRQDVTHTCMNIYRYIYIYIYICSSIGVKRTSSLIKLIGCLQQPSFRHNTTIWNLMSDEVEIINGRHHDPCFTAHGLSLAIHYDDVIMTMLASQITSLAIVYSIVYSGVDQRKHQSSASLAFVREIHRGPVNFPQKWPVTRKIFPFDDVIMKWI